MDGLFNMNKPRLYVALYAFDDSLGGSAPRVPQEYHWAVIIAPKQEGPNTLGRRWLMRRNPTNETPPRYHWEMIKGDVPSTPHHNIVVRVMIGKVKDWRKVADIIREAADAVDSYHYLHPTNNRTWIQAVVEALRNDAELNPKKCCVHVPEWKNVEWTCVHYAQKKVDQGRFGGRQENENWDVNKIPTLDMIHKVEEKGKKADRADYEVIP